MLRYVHFTFLGIILSFVSLGQKEIDYYAVGGLYADSGDFKKAITYFEKELIARPKNYYAWFNIGLASHYLGEKEKAINYYSQAISLKPDYARAFMQRALVKKDLLNFTAALKDLNIAILTDPDLGLGYFHRSIVHEYLENYHQACLDMTSAKKLGVEKLEDALKLMCEKGRPNNYANITKVFSSSTDLTYGFKSSNPIKVGEGLYGGEFNQIAYLNLLRGGDGEKITFNKKGRCCGYPSENSPSGRAKLDTYKISFIDEGGDVKNKVLYFTSYEYETLKIPFGLKIQED